MAKKLLTDLKIPFSDIDVADDQQLRDELVAKYHWQTVPMIIIGEKFIGGFDDLSKLNQEGKLIELLENA